MSRDAYTVKLDAFEGPLDLLLHLVKTNDVDIYHLPIHTITDQYLEYLGMMEELNLDVAGEYLVMAATLMYLKSRLLLPADDEADDDEPVEEAVDLVRQLAEYQRYREAADELRDRALLGRDVFSRAATPPEDPEEAEMADLDMANLLEALRRVLARAATRKPHSLADEEYHVADCVKTMVDKLRGRGRMEFQDLFEDNSSRGYIIATFVGLLELLKLHVLDIEQEHNGAAIYVSLSDHDVDEAMLAMVETYGQQVSLAETQVTTDPTGSGEAG